MGGEYISKKATTWQTKLSNKDKIVLKQLFWYFMQ